MPDACEKLLLACAHKKAAPKGGACSKHIRADDFDTNDKPGGASMTHADIHSKRGSHD